MNDLYSGLVSQLADYDYPSLISLLSLWHNFSFFVAFYTGRFAAHRTV